MAISRYDVVPQQDIKDTYVPPPLEHIKGTLDAKQNDYNLQQKLLSKATEPIMHIQVNKELKDAYGNNLGINPDYEKATEVQNIFDTKKKEIYNKYKGDFTNPFAKQEIEDLVGGVSNWYNKEGKQIENNTKQYLDAHKSIEEYRKSAPESDFQANANDVNSKIYDFKQGKDTNFQNPGVGKYRELNKEFDDNFKHVASQVLQMDADGFYHEGGKRYATIEQYLEGVSPKRVNDVYNEQWKTQLAPMYQKQWEDLNRFRHFSGEKPDKKDYESFINSKYNYWKSQSEKFISSKGKKDFNSSGLSEYEHSLQGNKLPDEIPFSIPTNYVPTDIDKEGVTDAIKELDNYKSIKAPLGYFGGTFGDKEKIDRIKASNSLVNDAYKVLEQSGIKEPTIEQVKSYLTKLPTGTAGVQINLSLKQSENQTTQLFGPKDDGSIGDAPLYKWTKIGSKDGVPFEDIVVEKGVFGKTTMGDLMKDPEAMKKAKSEGIFSQVKLELPITSTGGQKIKISTTGEEFTNGGKSFREQNALEGMYQLNAIKREASVSKSKPTIPDPFIYDIVSKSGRLDPKSITSVTSYKKVKPEWEGVSNDNVVVISTKDDPEALIISLDQYNRYVEEAFKTGDNIRLKETYDKEHLSQ